MTSQTSLLRMKQLLKKLQGKIIQEVQALPKRKRLKEVARFRDILELLFFVDKTVHILFTFYLCQSLLSVHIDGMCLIESVDQTSFISIIMFIKCQLLRLCYTFKDKVIRFVAVVHLKENAKDTNSNFYDYFCDQQC